MSEQTRIEDARLRNLYRTSEQAELDPEGIRFETGCTFGDAWRVASLRQVGSPVLIERWLRKLLTFRQLWRLVTDHPGDWPRQLDEHARRPRRGETERARRARVAIVPSKKSGEGLDG